MKFAFFGTPDLAVTVLSVLEQNQLVPELVVTNPDAPVGRKQILTPSPVKLWAQARDIAVFQPLTLKDKTQLEPLITQTWDLFVVVAYGKLIPEWLINLPKHQTLNLHPSLLPKLRGASPIRSAILNDQQETGVTIMLLDAELDHGPILAQKPVPLPTWPIKGRELDQVLATAGGELLSQTIPAWAAGEITPQAQNHTQATFCTKITKDLSELSIDPYHLPQDHEAYQTYLKICAFDVWPETFFMYQGRRIKIKAAHLDNNQNLVIDTIVPEGKNAIDFQTYFNL